ncbi:hypothetical protein J2T57_001377 [Natronocella acetinitrilica]|uniref:Uncharacterized protein n=1 Tax=Natronocella acetinitrilica TaxID=414046 RepID=A0AAE3G1U7_9GAMM|nr:hypothetical protein [Natronocella acetinitrilica]MCP1674275.1 hypothetical protein [Natronocella acetinitrilica]
MDYLYGDALPTDLQELLRADFLLNFYSLVGASSMSAEYIMAFDEVILLPEAERKAAVRNIIMKLNASGGAGQSGDAPEVINI